MISAYTAELIRTIVNSNIISRDEMQEMLCMTPGEMSATLEGSNTHITLHNLDCLTSFFGMQAFDAQFLQSMLGSSNYRNDGHRNMIAANDNVANSITRLHAYFGGRDNVLRDRLGRIGSTKCYVESCELMIDALKDAGVISANSAQEDVKDSEYSDSESISTEELSVNG